MDPPGHSGPTQLCETMLDDIRLGVCLLADTINLFCNILAAESNFEPYSVYVAGALETVTPVPPGQRFVQIMPQNVYGDRADVVSHYVCTYYDGSQVHIYDSLNSGYLSPLQRQFVAALFPQNPPIIFENVQQQSNMTDCGFFCDCFCYIFDV